MESHMVNIIYAALTMRTYTEKTTFSCKDMIAKLYIPTYYKFVRIMLVGPTPPVCLYTQAGFCIASFKPAESWLQKLVIVISLFFFIKNFNNDNILNHDFTKRKT